MNKIYEVSAQSLVGTEGVVETFEGKFTKPQKDETEKGQKILDQNPEQLLAAAHAYCFSLTMAHNAKSKNVVLKEAVIKTTVELQMVPGKGYVVASGVEINTPVDVDEAVIGELMKKTHDTCPVSKLFGNDILFLKVNGKTIH